MTQTCLAVVSTQINEVENGSGHAGGLPAVAGDHRGDQHDLPESAQDGLRNAARGYRIGKQCLDPLPGRQTPRPPLSARLELADHDESDRQWVAAGTPAQG